MVSESQCGKIGKAVKRANILSNQTIFQQGWSKETISKELEYAGAYIKKAPNNESSWNYARGIIKKNKMQYSDFPSFKVHWCW